MPINWKSGRFKPALLLSKIEKSRKVLPDGGTSFGGFEIHEQTPVLYSMLEFPSVAEELDKPSLIWRALSKSRPDLSESNFLKAINTELSAQLSKKEERYQLLTSLSFNNRNWPRQISVLGTKIELYGLSYPSKFSSRHALVERYKLSGEISEPSKQYCAIGVVIEAKSPDMAANRALRHLDLLRAIWCLLGNPGMQINFGSGEFKPINVVRLGSCHSIHKADGAAASEGVWYDPAYRETKPFAFKSHVIPLRNTRYALRMLKLGSYGSQVSDSLVRFVRAFDEPDPNTAFLKLWSALELLATPDVANYDKLIHRCSFLFQDGEYHRQILNHLREYRNRSVHAGEEATQARTNCFLLQNYYQELVWFHLRNARFFSSLAEANEYLSLPAEANLLRRQGQLIAKAQKFVSSV